MELSSSKLAGKVNQPPGRLKTKRRLTFFLCSKIGNTWKHSRRFYLTYYRLYRSPSLWWFHCAFRITQNLTTKTWTVSMGSFNYSTVNIAILRNPAVICPFVIPPNSLPTWICTAYSHNFHVISWHSSVPQTTKDNSHPRRNCAVMPRW